MAARPADKARVHLAAVHADPEARPVVAAVGDSVGHSLEEKGRARGLHGVLGAPGPLLEDDHELVAGDLVDVAANALQQRDQAPEVRVQHRSDFGRIARFREAREPGEICEEDAHVLRSCKRLVEVERAEALLVPLGARHDGDECERSEHEDVPLPPRQLPVDGPGDDDHRLCEEDERKGEREHEALPSAAVDPKEAEGGDPEERDPDGGEQVLPPVELLLGERIVQRRQLGEREDRPQDDHRGETRQEQRCRADHGLGSFALQLDRRSDGERGRDHEPDGSGELEARIRPEQDPGRRQGMQTQEAGAGDEGERDEEQSCIASTACRARDAPAHGGGGESGTEHEPEVRGVVLPALVDLWPYEEYEEEKQWGESEGEPGASAHRLQLTSRRVYPHPAMKVVLPDSSELELSDGSTGLEAARAIGPKLAEQAVLVRVDGATRDLRLPLADGERIQILTTRDAQDPDALYVLRHSTAHLLAEAVLRLYPGVKIAIGPPIDDGFYYDFEFPEPVSESDLEDIEAEMLRELEEGRAWVREDVSREDARARFAAEGQPYKVELAEDAEGAISLYTQGDFTDLCRGPHLQDSSPIKALKLTSLAGAYWRGDEKNTQLTRIYGTAFYSQADLDTHLERLEQARARDHRRIGRQLDLFHLSDHSPGSPFWHPKGMVLWNALEDLRRRENRRRGYVEVKTPLLYDLQTYITSGHYENYEENMFFVRPHEGDEPMALKPMNCPGHMLLFGSQLRSYRDLPIRYAESSTLHRDERGGTLHGLLRVKHITQDDAHVFVTEDQIQDEIDAMIDYVNYLYDRFGITPRAELSTRPDKRLGTDEQWNHAEAALEAALKRHGLEHVISPGEGTFYGPKIDLHMTDVLGRSWQMGTIQLDYQMPVQFGLTYMGADNREHSPVVIHRALLGSLERFLGILIEHYGGEFPFWLAPVQVRVLPVGESHRDAAGSLAARAVAEGFRADVDERDETVGKRIRDAELEKVPFVVVYGDRESEAALAVRERGGGQSTRSLDELLETFRALAAEADPQGQTSQV